MKDKILVNLSTDHAFECATDIIGREGEGDITQLEITIPENLRNCAVYLDFEKPNGDKIRTPSLTIKGGIATYDVAPYLLTDGGEITVQVVLQNEDGGVWKSSSKKFLNRYSINAFNDEIPEKEDFMYEAQKVLNELSKEVGEIAEILANNTAFAERVASVFNSYVDEEVAKLSEDIAKKMQLKPEFAKSEEWLNQNGDKAKLYVLPTNNIWAYLEGEDVPKPDTKVTVTQDLKLNKSNGTIESTEPSNYSASNFIEIKDDFSYTISRIDLLCSCVIIYYKYKDDSGKDTGAYHSTVDNFMAQATGELTKDLTIPSEARFFRIRIFGAGIDNNTFTVTTTYTGDANIEGWQDTGHAFVPADYEPEINELQAKTADLETRVNALEYAGLDSVPLYVKGEASRVADLLYDIVDENSLVIASCSDMHHFYSTSEKENINAIEHTAMGISEISKYIPIDLYINHGDYGAYVTGKDATKFIRYTMSLIYGIDDMEEMWLMGNHDLYSDITAQQMSAWIGKRNRFNTTDAEGKTRAYGYKDFDKAKIRVIYLNTTDYPNSEDWATYGYNCVSPTQCNWLINNALDFSEKTNPTEWGIVIASHIPLDMYSTDVGKALNIIEAYISGTSGSVIACGTTVNYNFTNKAKAKVICSIHGHTHNFISRTIGTKGILSLATPQVCFERYNNYATSEPAWGEFDSAGNQVTYPKTANTAEDTSFIIYVIDRTNSKVHAIHYGAGYDRVKPY